MIDAHAHVWLKSEAYPYQPTLRTVPLPTSDAPVEELLGKMADAGVTGAVLVQPAAYGWDNRYVGDCLVGRGAVLAGVCLVDPMSPWAVARLNDWSAAGFAGVRINLIDGGPADWLYGPGPASVFHAAAGLKLAILIQPLLHQLPVIARLAEKHPGLDFIVDYLGPDAATAPGTVGMVQLLSRVTNVTMKLLALPSDSSEPFPHKDLLELYRRIIDAVGPHRILLGSDYPNCLAGISYQGAIEWLRSSVCSGDEGLLEATDDTAGRLFFQVEG